MGWGGEHVYTLTGGDEVVTVSAQVNLDMTVYRTVHELAWGLAHVHDDACASMSIADVL